MKGDTHPCSGCCVCFQTVIMFDNPTFELNCNVQFCKQTAVKGVHSHPHSNNLRFPLNSLSLLISVVSDYIWHCNWKYLFLLTKRSWQVLFVGSFVVGSVTQCRRMFLCVATDFDKSKHRERLIEWGLPLQWNGPLVYDRKYQAADCIACAKRQNHCCAKFKGWSWMHLSVHTPTQHTHCPSLG